eukprot:4616970-Amphidinium_carterae.1
MGAPCLCRISTQLDQMRPSSSNKKAISERDTTVLQRGQIAHCGSLLWHALVARTGNLISDEKDQRFYIARRNGASPIFKRHW